MKQVPRERIALIVFSACILLIAAGIVAYMVAGHSWNHAASHIDDATGEMQGYRVVLFEGTAIPGKSQVDIHGARTDVARSLNAVSADYRSKEATTFKLDSVDVQDYARPVVLERDGYRIGVVHIAADDTTKDIQERTAYLSERNCQVAIAFTEKPLNEEESEIVDVVVDLSPNGAREQSVVDRDVTLIDMPSVGQTCAIIISPSEIVSTKIA